MTEKLKGKSIQNLTQYFFQQSQNPCTQFNDQIEQFKNKLFNSKTCILCKEEFNLKAKMPRILIHCGHTFCSACLTKFHRNGRIRCPLCLKLVKHIQVIERLLVNHTIVAQLINEQNKEARQKGLPEQDLQAFLFKHFEISQNLPKSEGPHPDHYQPVQQQYPAVIPQGPRIDPETGLEWCQKHFDRIKHFFCLDYKKIYCRVCAEFVQQNVPNSTIIDLYEVEDLNSFLIEYGTKEHQHLIKYPQPPVGMEGMFPPNAGEMMGKDFLGYEPGQFPGMLDQNLVDDDNDQEEEEVDDDDDEGTILKQGNDIEDITNLHNYGNNPDYQYKQGEQIIGNSGK